VGGRNAHALPLSDWHLSVKNRLDGRKRSTSFLEKKEAKNFFRQDRFVEVAQKNHKLFALMPREPRAPRPSLTSARLVTPPQ
jgi:hypothetical protein